MKILDAEVRQHETREKVESIRKEFMESRIQLQAKIVPHEIIVARKSCEVGGEFCLPISNVER